jgi:CRP-like cAMP-binding protein
MTVGAALCSTVRADGRRLVVDLLLPGDFFGFAASNDHDCTVEAVVDGTRANKYDRRSVEALADGSPAIAREIRNAAIEAMDRRRAHLLVVGRTTAQQKVGSFLLELADRVCREEGEALRLAISRYDIADYLAISTETVSRAFSALHRSALIEMISPQHIRILDREGLEECEETRSPCLRPN